MKNLSTIMILIILFGFGQNSNATNIVTRVSGKVNWSDATTWYKALDGDVSITKNSKVLFGKNTSFTKDVKPGDFIFVSSAEQISGVVKNILSDVQLELENPVSNSLSGAYGTGAIPSADDEVMIGNVSNGGDLELTYTSTFQQIKSLTFASTAHNTKLIFASGASMKIAKDVIFNQPSADNKKNTWEVGTSTILIDGSLQSILNTLGGHRMVEMYVTGGAVTINKDFNFTSVGNTPEQIISMNHAQFTIHGAFQMHSGTWNNIGNTVLQFNDQFVFGGINLPQFNSDAKTQIYFNGDMDLKELLSNLVLDGNSQTTLVGKINIFTPASKALISFGNLLVDADAMVNLNGNIWVAGNLQSKGGSIYSGNHKVWLSGKNKTIGGTSSSNLGSLYIYGGRASSYTVISNVSCSKINFPSSISNSSLNIQKGVTLNVLGDIVIQQPAAPSASALNVGSGTAQVSGDVSLGGHYQIPSQISKISISDGFLNINGNLVFNTMPASPQTAIIDMSTGNGSINLKGELITSNKTGILNTGIDEKRLHFVDESSPSL